MELSVRLAQILIHQGHALSVLWDAKNARITIIALDALNNFIYQANNYATLVLKVAFDAQALLIARYAPLTISSNNSITSPYVFHAAPINVLIYVLTLLL